MSAEPRTDVDRVDAFLGLLPGTLGEDPDITDALDRLILAERAEAIEIGKREAFEGPRRPPKHDEFCPSCTCGEDA